MNDYAAITDQTTCGYIISQLISRIKRYLFINILNKYLLSIISLSSQSCIGCPPEKKSFLSFYA